MDTRLIALRSAALRRTCDGAPGSASAGGFQSGTAGANL